MSGRLTAEQRKLAADNHNLIYSFANTNALNIEEYYGVLAYGLCKAAENFDPSKGFAFSTLAYRSMQTEFINNRWKASRSIRIPKDKLLSYDVKIKDENNPYTYLDLLSDGGKFSYDFDPGGIETEEFLKTLSEKERSIIVDIMNGEKCVDIARKRGCSRQLIGAIRQRIQKKWEKYNTDVNYTITEAQDVTEHRNYRRGYSG